jgi:hypothetical protein
MDDVVEPRVVVRTVHEARDALERVAQDEYPLARIQAKASLLAMGRGAKKEETPKEEVPKE